MTNSKFLFKLFKVCFHKFLNCIGFYLKCPRCHCSIGSSDTFNFEIDGDPEGKDSHKAVQEYGVTLKCAFLEGRFNYNSTSISNALDRCSF